MNIKKHIPNLITLLNLFSGCIALIYAINLNFEMAFFFVCLGIFLDFFDVGLQFERNDWKFGLMLRDITTTYNIWNIDEDEYQKIADAIPGENQDLPESTEITLPKAQFGISKKWEFHNDLSLLAATNLNVRFAQTNDIISTKAFSVDPALGFELGYTDLVFFRTGVGNFQNITQLDGSQQVGFQPNIGLGFKYKGIQIDYALTDLGDQSAALYSNIFSLKIDLGIFR